MNRITISLPEETAAALRREAHRRRLPVSQIAREAIEARVKKPAGKRKLSFIGIIKDAPPDLSENFDEYLAAARDADPRYDRYR